MKSSKSSSSTSFIDESYIEETLKSFQQPDPVHVKDIIQKSLDKQRLDPEDMATLIHVEDPELLESIYEGARTLKERVYGNRIVLFAPLYIGNECVNHCEYCGFRASNKEVVRETLEREGVQDEVKALVKKGHKRLIMVFGEHPKYNASFIHDSVKAVYETKENNGEIRRVNINAAPMSVEDFSHIKAAEIGTYQIFQETYHRETYAKMHPRGPKSDYNWRLYGLDRAMEAGIDDVGIGALMGLHDWRFEIMSLLQHTIHLESSYGVGPHTISFPRIEPAIGTELCSQPPNQVSDSDFKKLVAILRLSVPYTGLILTCRENKELRNELLRFGISQIDAGSSIGIGSYSKQDGNEDKKAQFELGDQRSLDKVIQELCESDFIPSFCTGCYRKKRTGEHFMEFAIPGFVKRFCTPNAVLTFLEYLEDYATTDTLKVGVQQIERELHLMPEGPSKTKLVNRMNRIRSGERDLYY
jgi:2-iminoacetate synthase